MSNNRDVTYNIHASNNRDTNNNLVAQNNKDTGRSQIRKDVSNFRDFSNSNSIAASMRKTLGTSERAVTVMKVAKPSTARRQTTAGRSTTARMPIPYNQRRQ
jgi:hypothetical protein